MVYKDLETLRKEKESLLRKNKAKASLDNLARKNKLEEKQLRAEIKALKNPRSTQARKDASVAAQRGSVAARKGLGIFGRSIKKLAKSQLEAGRRDNERIARNRKKRK